VGREAAVLVENTHTVSNNANLVPTTMFSNMLIAGFHDLANFGSHVASGLTRSNGRAFMFIGDGNFEASYRIVTSNPAIILNGVCLLI
jgi:hypothetical protein